ncbi:MAG: dephospho-CoA kinase [candidate division Zixibacteria bacterium]|nr:dephospho-CoA kinase [candidate division Zixibacteria bacterium]MDH3935823.1 dephospho-CoA kinase [candidate division Zixibacteria bacterium]MDH4032847.1 dephospho-CoA kinase [candidate division Zixibacteria bacterium]
MYIGLTGLIGSGKSTAAQILASHGAAVIDADHVAREVIDLYPELLAKLVACFGEDILTPTGKLRRKKLAMLAFAGERARQELNSIMHPYIGREIRRRMTRLSIGHQVVVIDAALLLGSSIEDDMDQILVIHASQSVRLGRLLKRGLAREDALMRMSRQLPFSAFKQCADRLIVNQDSLGSLEKKVANYFKTITSERPGNG